MPSVKAISPNGYDTKRFMKGVIKVKKAAGRKAKKELEKTTRSWTGDKPKFDPDIKEVGDDMIIIVDLKGNEHAIEKWNWINDGVPSHPIRAVNPYGKLFFGRTDLGGAFVPKTKPGKLHSMAGQDVEDVIDLHAPDEVMHPGFEARQWNDIIDPFIMGFISKEEVKELIKLATGGYDWKF
jgi:hypothetical protein